MYRSCQLTIFHNVNLLLPEMLYCISGIVGLQLNILLMCIKSVGRIAYYHRGHIALKHGSDWNIPMSEFHLAINIGFIEELERVRTRAEHILANPTFT